jgi:hypothetical protein
MYVLAKVDRKSRYRTDHRPWSTISRAAASVAAATIVLAGVLAQSASAGSQSGTRVGWGYDFEPDEEDSNCYDGCFTNSHRMRGVEFIRLGTGSYEIEMTDLYEAGPSDAQVSSAYANTPSYCGTSGWSTGEYKAVDIFVNCYDASGDPADLVFSFLYQSRSQPLGLTEKGIAFLWADQPTETNYTPNLDYQYNSTGATNTMVRNRKGSYTAALPGLMKKGGDVQVTAYGSDPARCKVASWIAGQSGTSVNVLCFDVTGSAADEMFTLAYTIGEPLGLFNDKRYICCGDTGAYASADKPEHANIYTPPRAYNYNGFKTGGLTVQRNSTGYYTVTVPGVDSFAGSTVLVTANGSSNGYCIAGDSGSNWVPITVYCYDKNGNPADSKFSVLLQTDVKK